MKSLRTFFAALSLDASADANRTLREELNRQIDSKFPEYSPREKARIRREIFRLTPGQKKALNFLLESKVEQHRAALQKEFTEAALELLIARMEQLDGTHEDPIVQYSVKIGSEQVDFDI